METQKKKFKMPHTYVILITVVLIMTKSPERLYRYLRGIFRHIGSCRECPGKGRQRHQRNGPLDHGAFRTAESELHIKIVWL